uniref:Uncharacterized protein n=1 Tax=Arundo donax TaxID=35708 RepID=A0A0A9C9L8_ARUDO
MIWMMIHITTMMEKVMRKTKV